MALPASVWDDDARVMGRPDLPQHDAPLIEELATSESWQLLRGANVGRLAVVAGNRPDVFPVNYLVDHGTVVFRTQVGTKLAATAAGMPVAFEVDGFDDDGRAWSVVIHGYARDVRGLHELVETYALPLIAFQPGDKPFFVRLEADDISGRRFSPQRTGTDLADQKPATPGSTP